MKQKFPWERMFYYGVIVMFTVLLSVLFACLNGFLLDGVISYVLIDVFFLAVLLYLLENNRICGAIGDSNSNNYSRIALCYSVCCVLVLLCYFLPEFTSPAAAFALYFALNANAEIAISASCFLCVLSSMAKGGNFYELAAYCLLVFIGSQMAKTMHEKKYRLWGCMILVSASVCIPILFYYLSYEKSNLLLLIFNGGFAIIAIILYHVCADRLYSKIDYDTIESLEKILKEDYPLVLDIKNYSKAEYIHAMKVATISKKCAAEIGADEMLATAAGFYYRLGMIEGEPFVENGIRLAEEKCFPRSVIEILSEYNGEKNLPSSKESAIVHMVDACLKKIEMLSGQNLSTSWNQDMVIYQTLNEVSATGIYDSSGLSMNQFLKVRELLVREEVGYDNND